MAWRPISSEVAGLSIPTGRSDTAIYWLIVYFFMAAVNARLARETPPPTESEYEHLPRGWPGWLDVVYDGVQALLSWAAVFALGFGPSTTALNFLSLEWAYGITLVAIAAIFGIAWWFYGISHNAVNRIRLIGIVSSAAAAVGLVLDGRHCLVWMGLNLVLLCVLLILFILIRRDRGFYRDPKLAGASGFRVNWKKLVPAAEKEPNEVQNVEAAT